MSEKIHDIADLLPEGVSDTTVKDIADLMDSVIKEQVESEKTVLEAKVHAYLRMQVDELKEQARRELELEDDTFRNAQLFEAVRSVMAVELNKDDEDHAISKMSAGAEQAQQEVEVLVDELSKALVENERLENTVHVLSDKIGVLSEQRKRLETEVTDLEESKEKPFKSSEKAMVIAENIATPSRKVDNAFLTDDVMKFMPFTKKE